jgi:hypothetical protein
MLKPGFAATSTTPAVTTTIAAAPASVRCSPSSTTPKIATCTASVLLNAVATENDRACIAASSSAVPAICAIAAHAVNAKNRHVGAGMSVPAIAAASARNTTANGNP